MEISAIIKHQPKCLSKNHKRSVNVGSKVRARSVLMSVDDKGDGRYLTKTQVTMEIEGIDKPAFVAETLSMFVTA